MDFASYMEDNNPTAGADQTERADMSVEGDYRAFSSTQDGADGTSDSAEVQHAHDAARDKPSYSTDDDPNDTREDGAYHQSEARLNERNNGSRRRHTSL